MGMNRTTTLKGLFRRFTVALVFLLVVSVAVPYLLLSIATNTGIANTANHSELQVKEMIPTLTVAPDLTKVTFPAGCGYLIMDRKFQELYGNMSGEEKEAAIRYAKGELVRLGNTRQFVLVPRENEICVLRYYIGSRFMVSWLPEGFPSPEVIALILVGINALLAIIFLTSCFAKSVRLQISPLAEAAENISKQNLDFNTGHSNIKEIQDVLQAFSDMKENLKASLDHQWKSAQAQKEQIAALAHDIKTPLTVVRGNAELLEETELTGEQKRYAKFISNGSEQMQNYMQMLIDVTKSWEDQPLNKEPVLLSSLLKEAGNQTDGLADLHKVVLHWTSPKAITIYADCSLLVRALINVISNAIEHSPQGGNVFIETVESGKLISFVVTDEGRGFTANALNHATEQFYMDDPSRSSKSHYGIGLYMAASIVEKHGGQILLENITENGGARVTIQIPLASARS